MGVDEVIVTGTGFVIYDQNLPIPDEGDFNPGDFYHHDAYDNRAPYVFFYEQQTFKDFLTKSQIPKEFDRDNDGWSLTDIGGSVFKTEVIINLVFEKIDFETSLDNPEKEKNEFKKMLRDYIKNNPENVFYGRFLYRYFS